MQAVLHSFSRARIVFYQIPLAIGIVWGLLGGLVATLVMDLILMSSFTAAGMPALSCFSIVGDTVARLLSIDVNATAGNIPLGIAAHYLVGPLMGILFGPAVAKVAALRMASLKMAVVWAVLFAEIMSQPLLAMTPILLGMPASATLQWYVGSTLMHVIWGCILGLVWSLGLRLPVSLNANAK